MAEFKAELSADVVDLQQLRNLCFHGECGCLVHTGVKVGVVIIQDVLREMVSELPAGR